MKVLLLTLAVMMLDSFARQAKGETYAWGWNEPLKSTESESKTVDDMLEIFLKEKFLAKNGTVTLNDITQCYENTVCKGFNKIVIHKNKENLDKLKFSKYRIAQILKENYPHLKTEIYGPEQVEVVFDTMMIDETFVKEKLAQKLQLLTKNHQEFKLQIDSIKMLNKWKVSRGSYRLNFPELHLENVVNVGRFIHKFRNRVLQVVAVNNDNFNQTFKNTVYVNLSLLKRVLTSKKRLVARSHINEDDVLKSWRVVHSQFKKYPSKYSEVDGLILKRPLDPGEVLTHYYLERPVVIKRGQLAKLKFKKGPLTLEARVIAKKSGHLGDVIDVYYQPTKKYLKAKIVSDTLLVRAE